MKWAQIQDIADGQKILYWVLMFILGPYFDDPLDHWLKSILKSGGGLGGDPGWEMEHIPSEDGAGSYRVWADPNISGIEPAEAIYSAEKVHCALRESLLAFAQAYPEKEGEVQAMLSHYNL